jgi:methylmalonyl-CoA mutase N-terminal domain/subunit
MREAGCTAVQELAFTLANAIAYVEAALQAGLQVDEFAPRLTFFFNAHNNLLEEVAKFRAARRMWTRIMRDRFQATDPRSLQLRFHTQTAGSTLTAQQPENNVVRVALQALAAVLGGTQSLHTNSMDEALGLPTEQAVRVALRTQQIIAHETGVADTVDPLAGSFYIEQLTNEIEARAETYLQTIHGMGGALAAVEAGYIQHEIQNAAYRAQQEIESKQSLIVGVNAFESDQLSPLETVAADPEIEATASRELAKLRATRDASATERSLDALAETAAGSDNLMPLLVDCVESKVTLGEICDRLRELWGEYQPVGGF